jgi:hypothetical protein
VVGEVRRQLGTKLAKAGIVAWLVLLVALIAGRVAGYSSWSVVLFPIWGVPALYVAFVVVLWALVLALVILGVLLGPWLR